MEKRERSGDKRQRPTDRSNSREMAHRETSGGKLFMIGEKSSVCLFDLIWKWGVIYFIFMTSIHYCLIPRQEMNLCLQCWLISAVRIRDLNLITTTCQYGSTDRILANHTQRNSQSECVSRGLRSFRHTLH